MSGIWVEWWRGRSFRAYTSASGLASVLVAVLDRWGPSFAEWVPAQEALKDWQPLRGHIVGNGGPGFWSERAQALEQASDRFAQVLQAITEHHNLPWTLRMTVEDELTQWQASREARYKAHPAAHTLEGSLTSGGIL